MPVGKSHKGILKRIKKTGTGKLMHKCAGKSHLLSSKSAKRKRRLRRWSQFDAMDCKVLERQYGRLL